MTAPRHVDVGAYVLGILDGPDEAAYEQHFAQCEECRREFIELADMPAILGTLKPGKTPAQPPPALPALEALIDFSALGKPPPAPPGPAVPPQQRPKGATQPHRIPHTNGATRPGTNGTPRPAPTGRNAPVPPPGTGRHAPVPKPGTPADGRNTPGTGRHNPVPPPGARAEGTGRNAAVTPPGTGRHAPVPKPGTSPNATGRNAPVANPGTGRNAAVTPGTARPVARPAEGTGRSLPASPARTKPPAKPPAKPPTKARETGPAGRPGKRSSRKPLWLSAAAVVAIALTVGMMIGLPAGDDTGNQVADPGTSAAAPPSDAVAGAHVVNGTNPDTGVTAIITIEPVSTGTEVEMMLYEIEGPLKGTLVAVSRFGDRQPIADFQVPRDGAASGTEVRVTGIAAFDQNDINRFEIFGEGTVQPLLVVPT